MMRVIIGGKEGGVWGEGRVVMGEGGGEEGVIKKRLFFGDMEGKGVGEGMGVEERVGGGGVGEGMK